MRTGGERLAALATVALGVALLVVVVVAVVVATAPSAAAAARKLSGASSGENCRNEIDKFVRLDIFSNLIH